MLEHFKLKKTVLCLSLLPAFAVAGTQSDSAFNACLIQQMQQAADDVTLGEIKARCRTADISPEAGTFTLKSDMADHAETGSLTKVEEPRHKPERDPVPGILLIRDEPAFTLNAHNPNYALPVSYNKNVNGKPFDAKDDDLDHKEFVFQISMRSKVWENVFDDNSNLYVAYTNRSWWQAYNEKFSSPFRDTNHEPEVFLTYDTEYDVFGLPMKQVHFGLVHQSNGRTLPLSRSWNRLYMNFLFEKDDFFMSVKPWWRIPENKKKNPQDTKGDDNPDIHKYMGYGELRMGYWLGEHSLGMMLRNNLRGSGNNKGAVQLDWTFPIAGDVKGYVQYFNGYGENLIDYNASVNRLSFGFMVTP
ncbi:phospholipase A [Spongorhabdus nitratireducens]